jgi:hypothetical protein
MRRIAVLACGLACSIGITISSPLTALADEKSDAVLSELATQLKEMRNELNALRQENQRLQAVVAQQQAPAAPRDSAPSLWNDQNTQVRVTQRPGGVAPSWLDAVIEQNRQRTLEAWARANAGERLSAERLARISAESRAVGVAYCPRPLRETALAGGDVKQFRDKLVSSRSSDFEALFGQVQVKEYLKVKAAHLSGELAAPARGTGTIAPANVRFLVDRMRRDLEDATILYGPSGLNGPAPAGLAAADELTRRMRNSSNPLVSGPTRDALDLGRRYAAVDEAVAADVDIEMVVRMQQVREANRAMRYTPTAGDLAADLAQVNDVLAGKVQREGVPNVQALVPDKN